LRDLTSLEVVMEFLQCTNFYINSLSFICLWNQYSAHIVSIKAHYITKT
jgi:hypothetical protein